MVRHVVGEGVDRICRSWRRPWRSPASTCLIKHSARLWRGAACTPARVHQPERDRPRRMDLSILPSAACVWPLRGSCIWPSARSTGVHRGAKVEFWRRSAGPRGSLVPEVEEQGPPRPGRRVRSFELVHGAQGPHDAVEQRALEREVPVRARWAECSHAGAAGNEAARPPGLFAHLVQDHSGAAIAGEVQHGRDEGVRALQLEGRSVRGVKPLSSRLGCLWVLCQSGGGARDALVRVHLLGRLVPVLLLLPPLHASYDGVPGKGAHCGGVGCEVARRLLDRIVGRE
mmetsp:Transcript_12213/g.36391  ORF Transcript_12213/g.36391 Transcript_12213/m.36391 type:complete len:286 (+) Transcript_12213:1100-1957(+)